MSTRDATWSFVLPQQASTNSSYVNPSAPPLEDDSWRNTTPSTEQHNLPRPPPLYPHLESPPEDLPEPLAYSNQSIRAGFLRKVFGIILIVTVECALAMTQKQISDWIQSDRGVIVLACSGGLFFVLFTALALIEGLRRSSPLNLFIVFIMAATLGYPIAFLCTKYTVESILLCVVLLTQSCIALSLLACDPNFNLVRSTGIAKMITAYIMLSSFVTTFYMLTWQHATWWNMYYAILGCTLTMTYLVIDIQMLMDDNELCISAEEYVFASVQIFLDVLNIFVYIIRILGTKREKD